MNFLQIIQLIVSLAPSGITLTTDLIKIIQEIEELVKGMPASTATAVTTKIANAMVAPSVAA